MMRSVLTFDLAHDLVPEMPPMVAQAICEEAFCTRLAEVTGCELAEVSNLYGLLSDNLRGLVHSREGWSSLARLLVAEPGFYPIMASLH